MTVSPTSDALRLEIPDEPVELRDELRSSVLEGVPWPDGHGNDTRVGLWLWPAWRGALEPAGLDREAFLDMVAGYRREQWLWLIGERRWGPFLAGLAGRVTRRLARD
jgi:hypothetical protein